MCISQCCRVDLKLRENKVQRKKRNKTHLIFGEQLSLDAQLADVSSAPGVDWFTLFGVVFCEDYIVIPASLDVYALFGDGFDPFWVLDGPIVAMTEAAWATITPAQHLTRVQKREAVLEPTTELKAFVFKRHQHLIREQLHGQIRRKVWRRLLVIQNCRLVIWDVGRLSIRLALIIWSILVKYDHGCWQKARAICRLG